MSFDIVPGGTSGWTIAGVGIIPGTAALLGFAGALRCVDDARQRCEA